MKAKSFFLLVSVLFLSSFAAAQDQCAASALKIGDSFSYTGSTYKSASAIGDTSGRQIGPTDWVDTVTKVDGDKIELVRISKSTTRRVVTKLTDYPNQVTLSATDDVIWKDGNKQAVFPLVVGKKWNHVFYRQETVDGKFNSQRIEIKSEVSDVVKTADDTLCTIKTSTTWSGGQQGASLQVLAVWSQKRGWWHKYESYRSDWKDYILNVWE